MGQYISLMDTKKNEVGRLGLSQDNRVEIFLFRLYADLENVVNSIGEAIQKKGSLPIKKAVQKDNIVVESVEYVKPGEDGYLNAAVSFINSAMRTEPRIFALVRETEEKQDV